MAKLSKACLSSRVEIWDPAQRCAAKRPNSAHELSRCGKACLFGPFFGLGNYWNRGMMASTRVPGSARTIFTWPPICFRRSLIPLMPTPSTRPGVAPQSFGRDSDAEIANPDDDPVGLLTNLDTRVVAAGVPVNVRQCFLNDAKNGDLSFLAQTRKYQRLVVKDDPKIASFPESFEVQVQRRQQP